MASDIPFVYTVDGVAVQQSYEDAEDYHSFFGSSGLEGNTTQFDSSCHSASFFDHATSYHSTQEDVVHASLGFDDASFWAPDLFPDAFDHEAGSSDVSRLPQLCQSQLNNTAHGGCPSHYPARRTRTRLV